MEFIPTRIRPIKDLHSFNLLEVPDKTTGRNDRTWSYGVFAEKLYPNEWENKVVEYNPIFNQPPLTEKELFSTVIASIKRKKYSGEDKEEAPTELITYSMSAYKRLGIKKTYLHH